jgi:hypothetical protein
MLGAPGLDFETWDTSISMVQNDPVRDLPKTYVVFDQPDQFFAGAGSEAAATVLVLPT